MDTFPLGIKVFTFSTGPNWGEQPKKTTQTKKNPKTKPGRNMLGQMEEQ